MGKRVGARFVTLSLMFGVGVPHLKMPLVQLLLCCTVLGFWFSWSRCCSECGIFFLGAASGNPCCVGRRDRRWVGTCDFRMLCVCFLIDPFDREARRLCDCFFIALLLGFYARAPFDFCGVLVAVWYWPFLYVAVSWLGGSGVGLWR